MMAAMFSQAEVAASLLAHGARRDAQDAAGLTPLAAARMMNAEATVALLSRPTEPQSASTSARLTTWPK